MELLGGRAGVWEWGCLAAEKECGGEGGVSLLVESSVALAPWTWIFDSRS